MPQRGGYYDIDAILATQQKLPCTFRLDIPGAGYLESEDANDVSWPDPHIVLVQSLTSTQQIKQGQKVDLPYWLAELLALR